MIICFIVYYVNGWSMQTQNIQQEMKAFEYNYVK